MTTWCRFEKDNVTSYGLVEDGRVIAVDGTPFGDAQDAPPAPIPSPPSNC